MSTTDPLPPDLNAYALLATHQVLHETVSSSMTASERIAAEVALLQRAQLESFPEEVTTLKAGKDILQSSNLISLTPALDVTLGLIRVGGRLRKAEELENDTLHLILLSPHLVVTHLLIKDYDERLLHPGPERVFAEVRRSYWILRGCQAIRKHQRPCPECGKWRKRPVVPQMADLPAARLRLNQTPFWSTWMLTHSSWPVEDL